jgi:hypothetical protein
MAILLFFQYRCSVLMIDFSLLAGHRQALDSDRLPAAMLATCQPTPHWLARRIVAVSYGDGSLPEGDGGVGCRCRIVLGWTSIEGKNCNREQQS